MQNLDLSHTLWLGPVSAEAVPAVVYCVVEMPDVCPVDGVDVWLKLSFTLNFGNGVEKLGIWKQLVFFSFGFDVGGTDDVDVGAGPNGHWGWVFGAGGKKGIPPIYITKTEIQL